ncbi:MAG: hypothetical protein K2X82_06760 [Gemmataceae bacterium]|nr:hypothetical protein [Gemmataceae bacterium]
MPSVRPTAAAVAACAALLAAPARADFLVTFTGEFDSGGGISERFDGTDFTYGEFPPLFDLDRLDGGSFRATFRLPSLPPMSGTGTRAFDIAPPALVALTLFDATGAVVHPGLGGTVDRGEVRNDRTLPGRFREDGVLFGGSLAWGGATGLVLPPERFGPNRASQAVVEFGFSTIDRGSPDIPGDLTVPTDGDTYLGFDESYFFLALEVVNGDYPDQVGPY